MCHLHMAKTPLQHNLTLFILPQVGRRADVFITPPNPQQKLFELPGLLLLLVYIDHSSRPAEHEPLSRVEKLRLWRHDAWSQHQYDTAEYIGNKVLSLTGDANDAFWLAQVYWSAGNYLRVEHLLLAPEYEQLLSCRYLVAYALIKLERWDDALDIVGETNPFHNAPAKATTPDRGIKLEALMCYLRGLIFASQNNYDRAKLAFREAVLVDAKCYEAFNELVRNDYLLPAEQWALVAQLRYLAAEDNDELVRLLYTLRVSKYINVAEFEAAEAVLADEYRLGSNADVLLARTDLLYLRCSYDECLAVCEQILARDECNLAVLPNYLACLYELGGRNRLFLKAHQLAELHPSHPATWLAIGVYYLSIGKLVEARKYFSKATLLSPSHAQAWMGFAHTFAHEGEHEQAISAYAFAARLFQGTHLPNLFLGMQHLKMNNTALAEEYLRAAHHICSHDPLLLNELGVVCYHKNNVAQAEEYLQEALHAARHLNSESPTWVSIHTNLGHVYRRANQPHKALECFRQALRLSGGGDCGVLAALGLVHLRLGHTHEAVDVLHRALALSPADAVASDLLKRALESNGAEGRFLHDMDARLLGMHVGDLGKDESSVMEIESE